MTFLKIAVAIAALILVFVTLRSAVRNFVLPRGVHDTISSTTFLVLRWFIDRLRNLTKDEAKREQWLAFYAPIGLLALLVVWLSLIFTAFMALFWATGIGDVYSAFVLSGSSLLTLGFMSDNTFPHMMMSFVEAAIGLILVALLIAYLPTIYSAFSIREAAVTLLDVRAGTPPSVVAMLIRMHRIGRMSELRTLWRDWELLFCQMTESHLSLPAVIYFRSPNPAHHWLTASGTVMDAAAFVRSTLDIPPDPQADLCIRAGYLLLQRIGDFVGIGLQHNPHFPSTGISITREDFDDAYVQLQAAGVPLKADRDAAWLDFAGWRVNYDQALISLCALLTTPVAPWTSDRAPIQRLDSGSAAGTRRL
jgi:hypothetical protein